MLALLVPGVGMAGGAAATAVPTRVLSLWLDYPAVIALHLTYDSEVLLWMNET